MLMAVQLMPAAGCADELDTVLEGWKRRQRAQTVSFRITGQTLWPAGSIRRAMETLDSTLITDPIPVNDHYEPYLAEFVLDLRGGRSRVLRHTERVAITGDRSPGYYFHPTTELIVDNTTKYQVLTPSSEMAPQAHSFALPPEKLAISHEMWGSVTLDLACEPILHACGVVPTTVQYKPRDLQPN